jgi:hypothetical protein
MSKKLNIFIKEYFRKLKDGMTFSLLITYLNIYKDYLLVQEKINKDLNFNGNNKKIRKINFDSSISENIVKFAIYKKYKIMPNWDTKCGDLEIDLINNILKIEVKGFISDGPNSFGPTENWDIIYFVDGKLIHDNKFIVYEIRLSNKNDVFRAIKLNEKETYGEIADRNQRGKLRGSFYDIFKKQLPDTYIKKIFEGHINELKPIKIK